MNQRTDLTACLLTVLLLPTAANADLFITNFTAVDGPASASGFWRNYTTTTDLTIPVSLTQTGGTVNPVDGSDETSTVDDGFPWQDRPDFPPLGWTFLDAFNPNYDGDHVNVEVEGGSSSVVTIHFNALIVDPVLNFTDVDTQSIMVFTDPFSIIGSTGNIVASTSQIQPDGSDAGDPFDFECAGSLRFPGTFASLTFTLMNNAPSGPGNDDRTGFSVSTTTTPTPIGPVTITTPGSDVTLMWPAGTYTSIQYRTTSTGSWQLLGTADPTSTTSWTGPRSMFGSHALFRGVLP